MLVLLPVLLGGLSLGSLWDAEGRMERVPAALVNLDRPARPTAQPGSSPLAVDAGKRLVTELRLSHKFDWKPMDEEEALEALSRGDVYLALTIPADFSSSVVSLADGEKATPAKLRLELDDANGYLIGVAAQAYSGTVQQLASTVALTYMSEQNTDVWASVRGDVDRLLNAGGSLTAEKKPDPESGKKQPGMKEIATQLDEASQLVRKVYETVQSAGSGSGIMSSQINDAAASAQTAQDNSSTGNGQLIQQSTTQSATSVRLAQSAVTELNSKLQTATLDAKGLLDRITQMDTGTKALDSSVTALEKELQSLAKRIPPARPAVTSLSSAPDQPATVYARNHHPAEVLGRGLAPFALSLVSCLSVIGAMSMLRAVNSHAVASSVSALSVVQAGLIPLVTVSSLATCGLFAVMQSFMQADALHAGPALAVCLLASAAFSAIGYTLKIFFGILGEILFIIFTVLQFCSAGGLYPVETGGPLFAHLHPYVPMSYIIDALRVTMTGGQPAAVWKAAIILLAVCALAVTASALCVSCRRKWTGDRLATPFRERCE